MKFIDQMGLSFWDGRLVWSANGGALRWAPLRVRYAIVAVWNRTVCALTHHHFYGEPTCVHCGKENR